MLRTRKVRRGVGLLIVALIGLMALPCSAQTASTPEDWVGKLAGLDAAPDLDLAALRQEVNHSFSAGSRSLLFGDIVESVLTLRPHVP